jgi:osmotically inducible protein OsmC
MMPVRKSSAEWNGTLSSGNGTIESETKTVKAPYSFSSRFQNGSGTNPEELIAAAHAGCFSMALALLLEQDGFTSIKINTTARVYIEKENDGFTISGIELETEGTVPGINEQSFIEKAEFAKNNCPVSKALASTKTVLHAKLKIL